MMPGFRSRPRISLIAALIWGVCQFLSRGYTPCSCVCEREREHGSVPMNVPEGGNRKGRSGMCVNSVEG